MAEFNFYCLQEDWHDLLKRVVEDNHLGFALDEWYSTNECPVYYRVYDKLVSRIASYKRRVYLVGDFTVHGLFLSRQKSGPKVGFYSISISYGGPAIDFSLPKSYEESGFLHLVNGSVSHPAVYWNAETTEATRASPELRAAYAAARKTIKSMLVRVDSDRTIWITPAAAALWRSGHARIMMNRKWATPDSGTRQAE